MELGIELRLSPSHAEISSAAFALRTVDDISQSPSVFRCPYNSSPKSPLARGNL